MLRIFTIKICMLLIFFCQMSNEVKAQIPTQDSLALVALYDSTNGAHWTNNTNWLSGQPVSTWYGITVSNSRISYITLSSNNLVGTIPSEIGNLTNLSNLDLSQNQLSGSIPIEIYNLINLTELNLSLNYQINDSISADIGNLTNLRYLYLHVNQLIGSIPTEIGNLGNLIVLYLFSNQLNGSIPTEIGNLTNLVNLSLSSNQFTGSIPSEIGNLTNLTALRLSSNQLTGSIPTEIDSLQDLTILDLANNALADSIPAVIGNLTSLTQVNLGLNSLTGLIPESIGNLTALTFLNVSGNSITGVIPDTIGNLTNLTAIYLNQNQLSGLIPATIGNMTNLGSLFLNNNQLTGAVPNEIVNIINLSDMGFEHNQLNDLPDLSSLNNLEWLVIQNNQFTFEDIEPNIGAASQSFTYSPQDSIGISKDTTINVGDFLEMSVSVGGTANQYQWVKDGVDITGATDSVYIISNASVADSGTYICRITNTIATDLTIYSRPVHVNVIDPTGISENKSILPQKYELYQNYPNPFNPVTKIKFDLPEEAKVKIEIVNVLGQPVATILNTKKSAGYHQINFDANGFASGVYFYTIQTENFSKVKKMMLVK